MDWNQIIISDIYVYEKDGEWVDYRKDHINILHFKDL